MKRKLAFVACGMLMTTLLLSGCAGSASNDKEQKESSQVETEESAEDSSVESTSIENSSIESSSIESSPIESSSSEVETSDEGTEESESSASEVSKQQLPPFETGLLDAKWLKKVTDYYASLNIESDRLPDIYVDGIRGEASFSPTFNDALYCKYSTMDGRQSITLVVDPSSETVRIDFDVQYGGSRFYVAGWDIGLNQLELYVDSLFEDVAEYEVYDDSAVEKNLVNLKEDVKILYSRLIAFANQAVAPLNLKFEDSGVDFGEKYKSFDPTQPTSTEIVIKNEHVFENGICKDCGMTWTKYMNRTLAAFERVTVKEDAEETDWFSTYGQDSSEGLPGWGYEQYSSSDVFATDLTYVHPDNEQSVDCTIYVYLNEDNGNLISVSYDLEQNYRSIGGGVVQEKYCYWLYVAAGPGEFSEIFASKKALRNACELSLIVWEDAGGNYDAWETMTESEIKAMFAADGSVYYTKDEFFDLFWDQHKTIFAALDKGMVWFDTSLKDCGFNYQ